MNIDMQIKYSTREPYHSWLCFNCAVKAVMAGIEVETEIGEYSSEYYMGSTLCDHPDLGKLIK